MDIATEVIKNNSDIFADFFFLNFSYWIASSVFSTNLKNADITHYAKKIKKKQLPISMSCQNINLVVEKDTVHNNVCWLS